MSGIVNAFLRMIAQHGETMTLSREGEGTSIVLKGKRVQGAVEETGNSTTQQVFRIRIATTELLASAWSSRKPAYGDTLVLASGNTVQIRDAFPLSVGDAVAVWDLQVGGLA